MCPHSDIDLLVLWGGKRGTEARAAEQVLYPLWDSGRRVGHATRTPRQCIEAAHGDIEVVSAMLDARLVAGRADLLADLHTRLAKLVSKRRKWLVSELEVADGARHRRYGHTGRLARPHLKEGRGGLRDATSLRWRGAGPDLRTEVGVLLAARARLHDEAGRAEDVLAPEYPFSYECAPAVYAAARRIALAHRGDPPPDVDLLTTARLSYDDALDAWECRPPAIPGWDGVACRPPANALHTYAVDTHLCVAAVEAAGPYEGFDADVHADLERPDLLVYAALLHDIGKGRDTDHSVEGARLVAHAAPALGLGLDDVETLALLVRHHLLLVEVATRRDLADEAAVASVVEVLGTAERLRLLYLLTRADARATADNMWGEWRAALVREAFVKALGLLESPATQRLDWRRAEVRQVLARQNPVALLPDIDRHLDAMPVSYLLAFRTAEQVEHFSLMRPAPAPGEIRIRVLGGPNRHTLLVAARDRPGLIASVTEVLAVHGIDILGARVFTRSDGVALQSYQVADAFGQAIGSQKWDRVRADLGGDVRDRLARRTADYAGRRSSSGAAPASVRLDNAASPFYTLVEVRAPDSVGLLARLTRTLCDVGIDIHVATITTEGAGAVDAFLVWDTEGQRLGEERFAEVETALVKAASTGP